LGDAAFYIAVWTFLVMSIVAHEVAHGWVALKLGDQTALESGRLTFNPLPHVDLFKTIVLPILTISMAGFVFLGAKGVPINPYNFKDRDKGMMISAIAGPITNIILGLFFTLILITLIKADIINKFAINVFMYVSIMNFYLAAFNMIPIPPLDGSRVLKYFLPDHMKTNLDKVERYGFFIIITILLLFRTQMRSIIIIPINWYVDFLNNI